MNKINLSSGNMLGEKYSFYLNNGSLKDSHFLYEFYSPGLNEDLDPYISMTKISDNCRFDTSHHKDSDILSICLGNRDNTEESRISLVENLLKRVPAAIEVDSNSSNDPDKDFPAIVMKDGLDIQKSLIVGLRDLLRWKMYKFTSDRFVDILWTTKELVVFKIQGDREMIWLEPVAMYDKSDINFSNPMPVNNIDCSKFGKNKFVGNSKASDLNRVIKQVEWNSFTRKPINN